MASTTSSRVNPARRSAGRLLVILTRHPHAVQRVGLLPGAVLPGHHHLEVAQALVRRCVGVGLLEAVAGVGVPNGDLGLEPLGGGALLGVVLDVALEDQRIHCGARVQNGAALPRRPVLQAQAAAEHLHARHHPDSDDGERDGDLEQREAACPGVRLHDVASSTRTVPTSGSSLMRKRSRPRSRRLATTTSAPLVLPLGQKRTCTAPAPSTEPPSTFSMIARSVSTAQRLQSEVEIMLRWELITRPCGSAFDTASTRQWTIVEAICRAARRTSRESNPPSMRGTARVSPMAMIRRTTVISMSVKPRAHCRVTRCRLPSS